MKTRNFSEMQPLRLYNTLTRTIEELQVKPGETVKIYTCGPTVYDFAHIGNFRTFIFEDILVKTLRHFGYGVDRVMNITDVGHLTDDQDAGEDKLEVGAKREGLSAWDIAKKYEAAFLEDMQALNLEIPAKLVRATDTIEEQIALIKALEEQGYTYQTSDGVYFDSSKVPDYGKLARLDIAGLQAGARVDLGEKRHAADFALWKFSGTPGVRHMEWESPWGLGFPGWHLECSAIIKKTLGETINIHCGGVDHIPVHHTNEIAQSESAFHEPLALHWAHGEFLLVDGGKMSKSLGNIYTLADFARHNLDPLAFRLFTYSASYRSKLNFTWEGVEQAQQSLKKLRSAYQQTEKGEWSEALHDYQERFNAALADDLNLPVALAVVWEVTKAGLEPAAQRAFLEMADSILSLGLDKKESLEIPLEIKELATQRTAAREAKNWALSDSLRTEIEAAGFNVLDTPNGQIIEKK